MSRTLHVVLHACLQEVGPKQSLLALNRSFYLHECGHRITEAVRHITGKAYIPTAYLSSPTHMSSSPHPPPPHHPPPPLCRVFTLICVKHIMSLGYSVTAVM
jgi:hypothetical protein